MLVCVVGLHGVDLKEKCVYLVPKSDAIKFLHEDDIGGCVCCGFAWDWFVQVLLVRYIFRVSGKDHGVNK